MKYGYQSRDGATVCARTHAVCLVLGMLFALTACSSASDNTESAPAEPDTSEADVPEVTHPPGELWADLDGDGLDERLDDDVEDRRVVYRFWEPPENPEDDPDDDPTEVIYPGQEEFMIEMPAVLVPAGAETFHCVFGVWDGPDRGVLQSLFSGDVQTNHHLILHKLEDDEELKKPFGEVFPCEQSDHHAGTPVHSWSKGAAEAGIGGLLRKGQRFYMELHTVNVFTHPVLVNAAFQLTLVPKEQLNGVSAAFLFGPSEIEVPPGNFHIKSTCTWPQDTNVLLVRGHMHELGQWMAVDWTSDAGTKRLLEVDPWEDEYTKEFQPGVDYAPGQFAVRAGDTFTTHCKWNNDTGQTVLSPREMCNAFGVAYPLEAPVDCDAVYTVVEHIPPPRIGARPRL